VRGATALAAVFAVKLAVLFSLGQHPLLLPAGDLDGAYYYHLAGRVAAGDVWLLDAASFFGQPPPAFFLSPLYVYVLAAGLTIGQGSIETARFLQILLGTAGVGLMALTARRWFGSAAGWWTGLVAAGFGLFTFYEILILQASLDPFLSALDLYLITRAAQAAGAEGDGARRAVAWWAGAGAALGLHALNRPNMIVVAAGVAVLVVAAGVLRARRTAFRPIAHAAVLLAAAALAIAPATVRNYRATGHFVPISSHGGLNLLIGNGPEADGTFVSVLGIDPSIRGQWLDSPRVVREALGRDVAELEVSAYFRDRAFDWMRDHPGAALRLLATKAWYAVSAGFLTLNHSYPFFARDLAGPLGWLVVGPALIVPLGCVGLVVARPRRAGYGIWVAYVPLAMLSVVVFFVAARYRLPFQVACCIGAGAAVAWAAERVRARDWTGVAWFGAAVGLAAVPVLWPTGLNDGRGEEQARMGRHEIQSDRLAEGEAWIARAIERHAFPGVVHLRAGQIYELRGLQGPAIGHYRKALAIDADQLAVRFALGRALYQDRRFEEAVAELERARSGRQADAATRILVLALSRLGRTADANAAVRALDPARWDAETAREFAVSLADVGRVDLSATAWQRAAETTNDARDYERLGLTWALLGRHPDAVAAFSQAVARDPKSATIRLNYAVAFASVGRLADARREAENALKLNPGYERAREFIRSISR